VNKNTSFSTETNEDYRITRQRLLHGGPEMTAYVRQLVEEEARLREPREGDETVVTDDDGDWEAE
jgi:hypothetical protein